MEHVDSQCKRILAHLQEGNKITPIEALQLFNCFRLQARIHDLEMQGHKIERGWYLTPTKKRVRQYWIEKQN